MCFADPTAVCTALGLLQPLTHGRSVFSIFVVVSFGADDRHQHAAALGAGRRGDPSQPGDLYADRQGLALRFDHLDGDLGERLPQGGVAGADGRHEDVDKIARFLWYHTYHLV